MDNVKYLKGYHLEEGELLFSCAVKVGCEAMTLNCSEVDLDLIFTKTSLLFEQQVEQTVQGFFDSSLLEVFKMRQG